MYHLFFRKGGTLNFTWHKIAPIKGIIAAMEKKAEIENMGYKCAVLFSSNMVSDDYGNENLDYNGRFKNVGEVRELKA